jgi:hypothetical protein
MNAVGGFGRKAPSGEGPNEKSPAFVVAVNRTVAAEVLMNNV